MTPGECPICDRDLGLAEEDEHFSRCLDQKIAEAVAKERERLASRWEAIHGYDKHVIAGWIRGSDD